MHDDEKKTAAEMERDLIRLILRSDKLEGIPLIWLQTRLERLLDGAPPEDVFLRQAREVQKISTKVKRGELALRVYEKVSTGASVTSALGEVADEQGASIETVQAAWKQLGKFLRET